MAFLLSVTPVTAPAYDGYRAEAKPMKEYPVVELKPPPAPPRKPRIVRMEVTAYTVEEGNGDGLTASGVVGTPYYTCASDDLPIGTKLRINGEIWEVQDRFGGGHCNRLDLLMDTKAHCYEWGRKFIDVEIIEDY